MIQGTLEYSSPSVAAVAAAGSLHRGMEKRDTSDFTWENWKYGHYLHRAASCVLDPRRFSLNGSICSLAICRFSCGQGVWERQKRTRGARMNPESSPTECERPYIPPHPRMSARNHRAHTFTHGYTG